MYKFIRLIQFLCAALVAAPLYPVLAVAAPANLPPNCTGCDLANLNLQGRDLRNVEWVGVDLNNADLRNADLRGARLVGADLKHVRFGGARLDGMKMVGADISDSDLTGMNFTNVQLTGADFRHSNLENSNFSGNKLIGVDFRNSSLRNANFAGTVLCIRGYNGQIGCTDFRGADLRGANFRGARICDSNMTIIRSNGDTTTITSHDDEDDQPYSRCRPLDAATLRANADANLNGALGI